MPKRREVLPPLSQGKTVLYPDGGARRPPPAARPPKAGGDLMAELRERNAKRAAASGSRPPDLMSELQARLRARAPEPSQ